MNKVVVDKKLWDTINERLLVETNLVSINDVEEISTFAYEEMKKNAKRFLAIEENVEVHTEYDTETGNAETWHELYLPEITKSDGESATLREVVDLVMSVTAQTH